MSSFALLFLFPLIFLYDLSFIWSFLFELISQIFLLTLTKVHWLYLNVLTSEVSHESGWERSGKPSSHFCFHIFIQERSGELSLENEIGYMGYRKQCNSIENKSIMVGVTPQVSIILEHRIVCEICVYHCLIVKNFQCKIRVISVILKNFKFLFVKNFNLGSKFNFVKGILANMLVIITWQLYCK